jgi:hypothetical protein
MLVYDSGWRSFKTDDHVGQRFACTLACEKSELRYPKLFGADSSMMTARVQVAR